MSASLAFLCFVVLLYLTYRELSKLELKVKILMQLQAQTDNLFNELAESTPRLIDVAVEEERAKHK